MASDVPCELRAAVQAGTAVRARGPKDVGMTFSANLPTQGLVPFPAAQPPSPVLTLSPGHSPEHTGWAHLWLGRGERVACSQGARPTSGQECGSQTPYGLLGGSEVPGTDVLPSSRPR